MTWSRERGQLVAIFRERVEAGQVFVVVPAAGVELQITPSSGGHLGSHLRSGASFVTRIATSSRSVKPSLSGPCQTTAAL
jgi:hypothetical protein